jgi:NAD(P)-dependent dehydrogenase (short-subunit alcohol dehydrogenase family)
MNFSFVDQVWLITGSSGIAAATARKAVAAGAKAFMISNDEEGCRSLQQEIGSSYFVADVTQSIEVVAAVRACVAAYGRIDALFNVVGISGRRFGDGPIHECSDDGWEVTMTTNVRSAFLMCRETIKVMLNQDLDRLGIRGAILNTTSVLAFSPEPAHFAAHAYAASKSAINGLTIAMASYYAKHKIRVNALAPGLTRTPMSARADQSPEILEFIKTKQPLPEDMIDPIEIAQAALFFLSPQAASVTGQILSVDGGWGVSG